MQIKTKKYHFQQVVWIIISCLIVFLFWQRNFLWGNRNFSTFGQETEILICCKWEPKPHSLRRRLSSTYQNVKCTHPLIQQFLLSKSIPQKYLNTWARFYIALFVTVNDWRQTAINRWIIKLWYNHTMKCYAAIF